MARMTDAFSTAWMDLDAACAVPAIASDELFARVVIPSIICRVDDAILPAADMISPAVPPTVLPISSNSFSTFESVLYKSCHSFWLRLLGDVLVFSDFSLIVFFKDVTLALCPANLGSFGFRNSDRSNSLSACTNNSRNFSKLRLAILSVHALNESSRMANSLSMDFSVSSRWYSNSFIWASEAPPSFSFFRSALNLSSAFFRLVR